MSCPQLGLTAPHPGTNSNISTRTREGQLLTRKWAKDQNIRKSKGRALLRKKCVTLGCDFPRGNEILSLQNSDTPSGRRVSLCRGVPPASSALASPGVEHEATRARPPSRWTLAPPSLEHTALATEQRPGTRRWTRLENKRAASFPWP